MSTPLPADAYIQVTHLSHSTSCAHCLISARVRRVGPRNSSSVQRGDSDSQRDLGISNFFSAQKAQRFCGNIKPPRECGRMGIRMTTSFAEHEVHPISSPISLTWRRGSVGMVLREYLSPPCLGHLATTTRPSLYSLVCWFLSRHGLSSA